MLSEDQKENGGDFQSNKQKKKKKDRKKKRLVFFQPYGRTLSRGERVPVFSDTTHQPCLSFVLFFFSWAASPHLHGDGSIPFSFVRSAVVVVVTIPCGSCIQ